MTPAEREAEDARAARYATDLNAFLEAGHLRSERPVGPTEVGERPPWAVGWPLEAVRAVEYLSVEVWCRDIHLGTIPDISKLSRDWSMVIDWSTVPQLDGANCRPTEDQ